MKVVAIILGGGQGKRLFPLTRERSKPAVPIGGKYRLVDIPISNSLHSGIKQIFVLTQFNSSSLNNHILNTYKFDYFSRASVALLAAEQTLSSAQWFQGTADAVRCHIPHYHLDPDDEVLILSGDHLYRMDYQALIQFHRKNKADVTLCTTGVLAKETEHFGILKSDASGEITDFIEKPKTPDERKGFEGPGGLYLASMGIYIYRAKVLMDVLAGSEKDFGKEIIPKSLKTYRSFSYLFRDYWRDIGTMSSFYEANIALTQPKPEFSFQNPNGNFIFTHPRFLPPSEITKSSIENALITEGCLIRDSEIKNSIVGLRTCIQKNAHVSRSIIMGADIYEGEGRLSPIPIGIGEGSIVENAIIDKNARIGKKVVIRNAKKIDSLDGEGYYIREGIVIIPKNATIADNSVI